MTKYHRIAKDILYILSRRYGMIDDKFAHDIAGHPVSAKLAIYDVILFLSEKYFLPLAFSANKHLVVWF